MMILIDCFAGMAFRTQIIIKTINAFVNGTFDDTMAFIAMHNFMVGTLIIIVNFQFPTGKHEDSIQWMVQQTRLSDAFDF